MAIFDPPQNKHPLTDQQISSNSDGRVYGNSKGFEGKVGMHQGSGLSPLLFVIVMEAISREFRVALPWELLYADDFAVIAEVEEELIKRLNEWKENVKQSVLLLLLLLRQLKFK